METVIFIICGTPLFLLLGAILFNGISDKCKCDGCSSGASGWRTVKYAKKYPDCKHNIYNQD